MRVLSRAALLLGATILSAPLPAAEPAGIWRVEGNNPDGTPYRGSLRITPSGQAWQFAWQTGSESAGIGVGIDASIAVAVGGSECAVVLYRIRSDGRLEGTWVPPQGGAVGTETAVPGRDHPAGLAGDYLVDGRNPNGTPYKGALAVFQEGEHWRLSWRAGTNYEGYGLERDGYLGVSWGSAACGVVLYRWLDDDALDGVWKYYQTGTGRERLQRE